jgi:hypothetical protein
MWWSATGTVNACASMDERNRRKNKKAEMAKPPTNNTRGVHGKAKQQVKPLPVENIENQ